MLDTSFSQGKLVTNGELDDAVLHAVVTIFVDLGHTKVVTTIDNDVVSLVREAKGNRQVERLAGVFKVIVLIWSNANAVNFFRGTQQEAGLDTSLDGKALGKIVVGNDGDVQVTEFILVFVPTDGVVAISRLEVAIITALTLIEESCCQREFLCQAILGLNTHGKVNHKIGIL